MDTHRGTTYSRAFTLVETMVVVAVLVILISLLLPALGSAQAASQKITCASNLRQIQLSNITYTGDNQGHFVYAAKDSYPPGRNLKRWHGVRDAQNSSFTADKSALAPYMGVDQKIRDCPSLGPESIRPGFELGNGGYGYNHYYIGGRVEIYGYRNEAARNTARLDEVAHPAQTIMFTDTAFIRGNNPHYYLIEYSFCEPPSQLPLGSSQTVPSISFRHHDMTNIAWIDGHGDGQRMTHSRGATFEAFDIGWPGPSRNEWFDIK